MLFRLGCLFVLVPLVELALLIWMGRIVGLWPTIALVAATGIVGAVLARREGTRALVGLQTELAQGRLPARHLLSGAAVLVGGALLLTPGILTDLVGFVLLLPPTRELIFRWAQRRFEALIASGALSMTIWERRATNASDARGGESDGSLETHGVDAGFGFGFARGPEPEHDRSDDGQPPRPGEIIQD